MSYGIIYDRRFIKIDTPNGIRGIMPLTLYGSSNVYETNISSGNMKRARSWGLYWPAEVKKNSPWATEKELLDALDGDNDEGTKFRNEWLTESKFKSFFTNGIKNAKTFGELVQSHQTSWRSNIVLELKIKYLLGRKECHDDYVCRNQGDFDIAIESIANIASASNYECQKITVSINSPDSLISKNPINRRVPKAYESPVYYTLFNVTTGGYFCKLKKNGYSYAHAAVYAKEFPTQKSAESYLNKVLHRISFQGAVWEVRKVDRYPVMASCVKEYEKLVNALLEGNHSVRFVESAFKEATYLMKKYNDNVSLAFASPDKDFEFRCWQFSQGVYTIPRFIELLKNRKI